MSAAPTSGRLRPRLSRTVARSRWGEYRRALEEAVAAGYRVVALEQWALGGTGDGPELVLRHDVDQHPRSALTMAAIERDVGVEATWYFRWRTADRHVVRALRQAGASVGLHYETLSRLALERGATEPDEIDALVPQARVMLRREILAFERAHGPIRSICAHGDSRIPAARNGRLLEGEDPASFGVELDANEAMRGRGLAHWLTDRSRAEGSWAGGVDPAQLLAVGASPILCVVHPNNWVSGASLWADRLLAAALPDRSSVGARGWLPPRTGGDAPPV